MFVACGNFYPVAEPTDDDQKTVDIDLEESGLLWLFNQAVLHDLGYHLIQVVDSQGNLFFRLAGGGNRRWVDFRDPDKQFQLLHATLAYARKTNGPDETGVELKVDPAICAHNFTLTLSGEKRICPACDTVLVSETPTAGLDGLEGVSPHANDSSS